MAIALVAVAAVMIHGSGLTSRRTPWPGEAWVARAMRSYLTPASVRRASNPVPDSPESVQAGLAHFADHCASCHANDGSGDIALGRAMFPPPPDMRVAPTQAMTDGELFYVIEHGIPLSGMAAWGNGSPAGERSTWELVRFIRHLPGLTAEEITAMKELNPRSKAESQRAKEIRDFLSGGTIK